MKQGITRVQRHSTTMNTALLVSRISAVLLHGTSSPAASTCPTCLMHAAMSAAGPTGMPSAHFSRSMSIYSRKPAASSSTSAAGPAGTSAATPTATHSTHSMTSWFTKLRTALFPVPASAPKAATQGPKPAASGVAGGPTASSSQQLIPLSANVQRLLQAKEAAKARELQAAASSEVFIPLSSDAERFSGLLFKVSMAMITIPLAIWFVSTQLLVTLCIKGLRSPNPEIVKISLSRVQSYVFNNAMAGWFERDDGVVLLVSMLGHQAILGDPDVILLCLATITHLMKFEETRTALLLGMVTERLKKALDQGLLAADAVEEGHRVYQSLEAMKKLHMEQMFGVAEGGST